MAREIWPDGHAIGRRFRNTAGRPAGSTGPWQTVIGVVPDVVSSLVEATARPAIYRPLDERDARQITLLVHLHGQEPTARLRQFATSVQPDGSEIVIESVREKLDQTMAEPRFTMRILATFAALGVVLAAVGLFGVISYTITQRTREIGVRMALGATRGTIARLVVGDGIRLALVGIAVGLLGAVAATRLVESLLYGVPHLDPFSFGAGAILLLAVSAAACIVPMLRATGVDPVIAVRVE